MVLLFTIMIQSELQLRVTVRARFVYLNICSAKYTVCTLPYMYKNTRWCSINTYNISLQKLFSHIIYTIIVLKDSLPTLL